MKVYTGQIMMECYRGPEIGDVLMPTRIKAYSESEKTELEKTHNITLTELEAGVWFGCPGCQQEVQYPHKCGGL